MSLSAIAGLAEQSLPIRIYEKAAQLGALSALVGAVVSVAMSSFGFLAASIYYGLLAAASLYFLRQFSNLKSIETYEKELEQLNASVAEKNREIQEQNRKIADTTKNFINLQAEVSKAEKAYEMSEAEQNAKLAKLLEKLQTAAGFATKVEASAKADLDAESKNLTMQLQNLEKKIREDQELITKLKEITENSKKEAADLQNFLLDVQNQMNQYKQENTDYAEQNAKLALQVKELSSLTEGSKININLINQRTEHLEEAILREDAKADQLNATADKIAAILDRLDSPSIKETHL